MTTGPVIINVKKIDADLKGTECECKSITRSTECVCIEINRGSECVGYVINKYELSAASCAERERVNTVDIKGTEFECIDGDLDVFTKE